MHGISHLDVLHEAEIRDLVVHAIISERARAFLVVRFDAPHIVRVGLGQGLDEGGDLSAGVVAGDGMKMKMSEMRWRMEMRWRKDGDKMEDGWG